MTIKEFAHKHSLTFFWSTIVLAIIILLVLVSGFNRDRFEGRRDFRDRDFDRRGGQMMNRPMMNNQNPQPQAEQVLPVDNTSPSQSE